MFYQPRFPASLCSGVDFSNDRLFGVGAIHGLPHQTVEAVRDGLLEPSLVLAQTFEYLRYLIFKLLPSTSPGYYVSSTFAPSAVLLGRRLVSGTVAWKASGLTLQPNLILTARHVATGTKARVNVVAFGVEDGLARAPVPIDVNSYFLSANADVALLYLDTPKPSGAAPVRGLAASDLVNRSLLTGIVGFGGTPAEPRVGRRNAVLIPVTAMRRSPNIPFPRSVEDYFGFRAKYEYCAGGLGFDTCPGDSGAPSYVLTRGGEWLASGITSRATKASGMVRPCGDGGVYTRLDKCWAELEAGANNWGLSLPPLVSA